MRVCVDGRRLDRGGIRRITDELTQALSGRTDCELLVLRNTAAAAPVPGAKLLLLAAPYLSFAEHRLLPEVLAAAEIDLFVSPQFYITAALMMPLVSWVHDTWPVRQPDWLPPAQEVFADKPNASQEGNDPRDGRKVAQLLLHEYFQLRSAGHLFPGNAFLANRDRDELPALARVVLAMYALNLARSRLIVTVTEAGKQDIVALFPEVAERVRVVYNPVFAMAERGTSASKGVEPTRRLLHVSKWEPRKNIPALVDAFNQLAATRGDLTLELVGQPAVQAEARAIHDRIRASRFADRIRVHGVVEDAELQRLYATATLLVMPSLFEGFSLPIVEAMSAGLPIAAARVGAIPEVVGGAAELFDPSDPRAIVRAMACILDDEGRRLELVAAGRARVAELASRDFTRSVLAVIAEATGR